MAAKTKQGTTAAVYLRKASSANKPGVQEKIRKKAYELYESRGKAHGNDLADWFEAERIVAAKS